MGMKQRSTSRAIPADETMYEDEARQSVSHDIEKATASAADLWNPRNGFLDALVLIFLLTWYQLWDEFESHFGGLWPPLVSATRPWCHLGSTGVARVPKGGI